MLKNEVKIKILKSKVVSGKYGHHKQYYLQLSYKNNKYNFNFFDSVYSYCNNIKLDKKHALYCVLMDCRAYDDYTDIQDFADAFGYEKIKDLLKAYDGCKKTSEALHNIFNNNELEQLYTEFQDY